MTEKGSKNSDHPFFWNLICLTMKVAVGYVNVRRQPFTGMLSVLLYMLRLPASSSFFGALQFPLL